MLNLIKSIKTNWRDLLEINYNNNRSCYKELENALIRYKDFFEDIQEIYPPEEYIFKTFDFDLKAELPIPFRQNVDSRLLKILDEIPLLMVIVGARGCSSNIQSTNLYTMRFYI